MASLLTGGVTGHQVFSHLQKNRFAWQCPEAVLYCHNLMLTLGKSAALFVPPCALATLPAPPPCLEANKKWAGNVFADTVPLRLGFSQPRVGQRKQPHASSPDPLRLPGGHYQQKPGIVQNFLETVSELFQADSKTVTLSWDPLCQLPGKQEPSIVHECN